MKGKRAVSGSLCSIRLFLAVMLAAFLLPALPAAAQHDRPRHEGKPRLGTEDLHHILDGLERGMVALKELGRHEELEMLERVANGIRRELRQEKRRPGQLEQTERLAREARKAHERAQKEREHKERAGREHRERDRGHGEREILRRQLEALRLALPALREAERRDAADLVHRAIRAREVILEGRRDDEAHRIREGAPNREQLRKFLVLAEEAYRKFDLHEKAARVSRLTEELWAPRRRRRRERDIARRETDRPHRRGGEREAALHQIEVMEIARHALLEADKKDAADIMKRAMQVRKVNLKGLKGEEANLVRRRAPSREEEIEILGFASKLWREFGHAERAETVGHLARKMRDPSRRNESTANHLERLHRQLSELQRGMEKLKEELRRLDKTHY